MTEWPVSFRTPNNVIPNTYNECHSELVSESVLCHFELVSESVLCHSELVSESVITDAEINSA